MGEVGENWGEGMKFLVVGWEKSVPWPYPTINPNLDLFISGLLAPRPRPPPPKNFPCDPERNYGIFIKILGSPRLYL